MFCQFSVYSLVVRQVETMEWKMNWTSWDGRNQRLQPAVTSDNVER